ncbi:MAG: hypothetical protein TU36_000770 [Vulcanisaeta sp. AZ3]|nr:MAG: hypothetical protein TU36_02975 [Vulcanisaeta sp. AZ3]
MDFRDIPINECPIKYLDTLHLILLILYRRAKLCSSLDLKCLDLPILATTPLVAKNCDRDDVYKFFRRMRRIVEKMGDEIEIFRFGKLSAYLSIVFKTATIKVHNTFIVNDEDCKKVNCVTVNNVTTLNMRLIVKLSNENLVILNIPDAVIWLSKMYGFDVTYGILKLIHDYIETGTFNDEIDELIEIVRRWGINIDRESFIRSTLPGKRNLEHLREIKV